jgi:hypothetical protein
LNEITLPSIAKDKGGRALVAGGGKFTAHFDEGKDAEDARAAAIREISTRFPMLEWQVSWIVQNERLVPPDDQPEDGALKPLMDDLKKQKQSFRGYGVSFNPHLLLCEECGEYPAVHEQKADKRRVCRTCQAAKDGAAISLSGLIRDDPASGTTIQQVYRKYLEKVEAARNKKAPHNFEDLFPKPASPGDDESSERRRMAVWLSDINNMKNKVNIWLKEPDILETFRQVKAVFIDALADALSLTFPKPEGDHLPFRVIIAGGDDLCLVMAEEHILDFAVNLSASADRRLNELGADHPLNPSWLKQKKRELEQDQKPGRNKDSDPGPYCFGGAFVIASIHTPFRRIHEVGEELMSAAKKGTKRLGDGVNWRIMSEEASQTDRLLTFEKPIFIRGGHGKDDWDRLNLEDYLKLRKEHGHISGSHRFQIISKMIELRKTPDPFERWLKAHASSEHDKDFSGILTEKRLRKNGRLALDRVATLFELMSVKGGVENGTTR